MRNSRIAFALAGGAVLLAIAFSLGPTFGGGVLAAVVGAVVVASTLRCRHPHPALQPATVDFKGQHTSTHWYCDDCGRRWPATFDHGPAPVVRFSGFDPSKAVTAARRAATLDDRRRELAVERAGLRLPAMPGTGLRPVPIDQHRPVAR